LIEFIQQNLQHITLTMTSVNTIHCKRILTLSPHHKHTAIKQTSFA